jgi:phospholipid transport system substrate-binding protein
LPNKVEGYGMKRLLAVFSVFLFLLLSLPVHAGAPMDTVQANVDKVIEVLRDPKLKAESVKETKKERLHHIYDDMFDQVELSRRALAQNWNKLNLAQREEFVNLFRQMLEKTYIDQILAYVDEKVVFDREVQLSGTQAEIQTTIVTSSKKIPVFYRVILKGGEWKVYDVVIENVSLVSNYRTQFNDILAKNTPEQMLEILRKKVKGQ